MKAVKTKLHHHRKGASRPSVLRQESAGFWELDHDRPDPEMQLYRIERSPKQENL
jgi:hypothetical protein